ncbi:13990_t:CDS:2 [Ambispora leptoticha]|uniref:13990_t:CDS:1 n=1 Tax=Ambispora leptoticha TaxID=144679 RepID=A0A9N9F762_9GLOM|nr:13990_t:CDS:2 [Ambispora leptoticha]
MPLLPKKFSSLETIHAFKDVDRPRGAMQILSPAICALVLNISIYSTKFEWMRTSEIAPVGNDHPIQCNKRDENLKRNSFNGNNNATAMMAHQIKIGERPTSMD